MAKEIYEIERFLRFEINLILEKLIEDKKPLWGSFTPQQMIEHLVLSFKISNGTLTSPIYTPAKKLNKIKLLLWGKRKFSMNLKNPAIKKEDLKLRFQNLQEAKENLLKEINLFTLKFYEDCDLKYPHPVFGILMKDEWFDFHFKHILHHFAQFGLIEKNFDINKFEINN